MPSVPSPGLEKCFPETLLGVQELFVGPELPASWDGPAIKLSLFQILKFPCDWSHLALNTWTYAKGTSVSLCVKGP